jgi:hypothetical protein
VDYLEDIGRRWPSAILVALLKGDDDYSRSTSCASAYAKDGSGGRRRVHRVFAVSRGWRLVRSNPGWVRSRAGEWLERGE